MRQGVAAHRFWDNTVSLAVVLIAAMTMFLIGGVITLLAMGRNTPDGLIAVMGSGMGALATLLTTSRMQAPPSGEGGL